MTFAVHLVSWVMAAAETAPIGPPIPIAHSCSPVTVSIA